MCDASSNYCWMQVDPSAPGEYELLLDMPDDRDICYSLCYNPSDDCLYGVTVDQEFVRIARDGTQEILFKIELDNLAYYIAGLVYSPIEGLFHWNPNFYDYTSAMATISLDGTVDVYESLEYGEEFNVLFTSDINVGPASPARPELVEVSFEGSSLDGYSIFRIPSLLVDGTPVGGPLTCRVFVDKQPYRVYEDVAPGSELKVEYTGLEEGLHHFVFRAEYGGRRPG